MSNTPHWYFLSEQSLLGEIEFPKLVNTLLPEKSSSDCVPKY